MGVPPPVRTVTGILENIGGNSYPCGNGYGGAYAIRDLCDDNFDHTGLNFIGGAYPEAGFFPGGGPNNFAFYADQPTPAMIGSTFKASLKDAFLPTKTLSRFRTVWSIATCNGLVC